MDIRACIPKDKFDVAAIERAGTVGFPALNARIPEMLEWVQDINWPVAEPTARLLTAAGPAIVPHILKITSGDDPIWKYSVIDRIVARLPLEVLSHLEDALVRLSTSPGPGDRLEEVDVVAQQVLAGLQRQRTADKGGTPS